MTGILRQIIRRLCITQHRRAADPDRFAEGDNLNIRAYSCRITTAPPFTAADTDTMRIIRHQPRVMLPGERQDRRQRRGIPVHTEDPFSDHQGFAGTVFSPAQPGTEMGGIIMMKTAEFSG